MELDYTWTCMTLVLYKKHLTDFATSNINVLFFQTQHIICLGNLDLSVLQIA